MSVKQVAKGHWSGFVIYYCFFHAAKCDHGVFTACFLLAEVCLSLFTFIFLVRGVEHMWMVN